MVTAGVQNTIMFVVAQRFGTSSNNHFTYGNFQKQSKLQEIR